MGSGQDPNQETQMVAERNSDQGRPQKETVADSRIGTQLGNYVLREVIGRGGMGVVYRGEHIYIHRPVAIKVLGETFYRQPKAKNRFLEEAQAASAIDHPNVVSVTDFGEAPDGTLFLVMACIDGTALDDVLNREKHLGLFRSIDILGQICRGLGQLTSTV